MTLGVEGDVDESSGISESKEWIGAGGSVAAAGADGSNKAESEWGG